MSKQIRVSDAMFDELKRMSAKFDTDKRNLLNAAIVLLNHALENDASVVEFISGEDRVSMPVPLIFKRKR